MKQYLAIAIAVLFAIFTLSVAIVSFSIGRYRKMDTMDDEQTQIENDEVYRNM